MDESEELLFDDSTQLNHDEIASDTTDDDILLRTDDDKSDILLDNEDDESILLDYDGDDDDGLFHSFGNCHGDAFSTQQSPEPGEKRRSHDSDTNVKDR